MITIQAQKYITLATMNKLNAWQDLVAAINAAKQQSGDNKVCVSFMTTQVIDNNPYLSEILRDEQVVIECIKNNPTHKVLTAAAMILLHDNKKVEEKFIFHTLTVNKTLSSKELEAKRRVDKFKHAINTTLDTKNLSCGSVFVAFADITRDCGINNLKNDVKALASYFETLKDVCLERGLKELMVSMRNIEYRASLIDTSLKTAIRIFKQNGLKITFTDCDDELNARLRLHMKLIYNNGTAEDALEYIKKLGIGRVVLLTKLKEHDTENMLYREDDEVVAQFIAIVDKISNDTIEFKYTGFDALKTYHDLLAYYGSPDEFDDKLLLHTVPIKLKDLGCIDIRIAKSWHLNLLNGDVEGSDEFNYVETHTSETIKFMQQPEAVVLPEFIRRSLRSWHITFNERAMLIDIQNFKKKCKRKR